MPSNPLPSAGPDPRRIGVLLFAGTMLLYLSIWKGDGGYLDLRGYLDDAVGMWLRGDLADPNTPPGAPKKYNRFSLGLPFLSGPFVYLGAAVDAASGGAMGTRSIAAFAVPVYGALACVLLFSIGIRNGFSCRTSLWAALIFGLGGPMVSYTRLYYAEVALSFCLFLSLWAHLRGRRAIGVSAGWNLFAGAGLAGVMACHYPNGLIAGILWLAYASTWLADRQLKFAVRVGTAACMAIVPALTGLALMYLNNSHYGDPFRTGYHVEHADVAAILFSASYIPSNLVQVAQWVVRVPWAPLALLCWIATANPESARDGMRAPLLRAGVLGAYVAQAGFWLLFLWFPMFGLRYQMPLMALASPGLLYAGAWLERRWPARGLALAGAILFTWNLLGVLRGDDSSQIVFVDHLGRVCSYLWYMRPFEPGHPEGFGTPAYPAQIAIFLAFALPGLAFLFLAARRARAYDSQPVAQ